MAKLILTFNKKVIREYSLDKGGITIGRNEENSVVIDNLAVSGFHARIDKAGSEYILTDLQSTNGTFVNDQKVTSHKLGDGDNILVGKHVILFVDTEAQSLEDREKDRNLPLDRTIVLDTLKQRELLARQKVAAQASKAPEKVGVLSFIDGSGLGDIELIKKLTKLGKADTSEIRLSGILMPATAATISRRPSGYAISFTGGMTKLKVNRRVVKDSVPLKDFDTIELGSYKFQFYQKEIDI
jgi:pSer/pThr/pTyr-binding forkhead associated (FHA) protein